MTTAPLPWLAFPWLLPALLALPAAGAFLWYARGRRQLALDRLGSPLSALSLVRVSAAGRRVQTAAALVGLLLLALAAAGPRWGADRALARTPARDLIVVLDLSRSMTAEQPSRQERAMRLLRDLADALARRGGPRVALVTFAGLPRLLFPLTTDYDHFRHALARVADDDLPPPTGPVIPAPPSGTRIGAALRMALEACDPERRARSAILLVSDGDDPAGDDEWRDGAVAAQAAGVPVCAVGVGDPDVDHPIPAGDDVVRHQGEAVQTRLREAALQEIARRTGAPYLPARTGAVPLGELLLPWLRRPADDPADAAADGPPALTPRHAWFLAPALLLLMLATATGDGPRRSAGRSVAALAVVLLVSAAPPAAVTDGLRQGNEAFARAEFEQALREYARAAEWTPDPGLVAFNQAAALYRLGHFREAELHYRRALEDDMAPPARHARASFALGNALVRLAAGQDADRLRGAVAAYHRCLAAATDPDLRTDARHNLTLAQAQWREALAKQPEAPNNGSDPPPQPPDPPAHNGNDAGREDGMSPGSDTSDGSGTERKDGGAAAQASKLASRGTLQVLPDRDPVEPLSEAEAAEHLRRIAERIRRERQRYYQQQRPAPGEGKDW